MTLKILCFITCALLAGTASAQTDIVTRGDTLLLPNGVKFWLGEQVTLGTGSAPDRSFNYIYDGGLLRMVKKKQLSGSYSGQTATISKFQRDGAYKDSYSYNIIVLDFGRRRTYWCDVQGALNNNELANTNAANRQNTINTPSPETDKAARLAKLKQLFDSGQITKDEYETLKSKLDNEDTAVTKKKPASTKKAASSKRSSTAKKPATTLPAVF